MTLLREVCWAAGVCVAGKIHMLFQVQRRRHELSAPAGEVKACLPVEPFLSEDYPPPGTVPPIILQGQSGRVQAGRFSRNPASGGKELFVPR